MAELLIAVDRSAEAEPLLKRAFEIIVQAPYGEAALRERFSHIDANRLVHAVPTLRDLISYTYTLRYEREPRKPRMFSRVPSSSRDISPEEAQEAVARLQRDRRERAMASQAALEIEAGRLAYQIPERMWVGVQETAEVRLGTVIANELMQGFVGRGDVKLEHVPIVETMAVSLVCQPGTFEIEPRSREAQLVKPDLVKGTAFHQQDFAKWVWLVTPRQRGKHTLLVKVSAAIKDSRGLPTTSALPDEIIAVTVRVDVVRAATGAFWRVAPGLAWAIATTLVGIFTKDYWWPAVRSWLGM